MAEIVARVGKVTGEAFARNADGELRRLKSGDPIREGEVVQAGVGGEVQLKLVDGRELVVGPNEAAKLDAEVAASQRPDAGDSAVQNSPSTFARISKAIIGFDGTFSFEDDGGRGANPGFQKEGHSFVELARIIELVDPLAFQFSTARGQPLDEIRGGGIRNEAATVFTFAPPETENISLVGREDSPLRIDLKGSDSDGIIAGYVIRSLPADGALYADAALTQQVSVGQTVTGPVFFKPNDNWNGTTSFRYASVDNTGSVDETPATVTIDIAPVNDLVGLAIPDVNGVESGQSSVVEDATMTGKFTISAPDGLDSAAALTIAGTAVSKAALEVSGTTPVVIATAQGMLTITGYNPVTGVVSYSYDPSGTTKDHTGGEVIDVIGIVVKDNNGDTQSGTLSINILDTVPVAKPDTASIAEDAASDTVGGNVISAGTGKDVVGADAVSLTAVSFGGNAKVVGTEFATAYGYLTLNADGSYSYRLDNTNAAVNALKDTETLSETFTYTITDADGDPSSTTLTITLNGTTDGGPSIVPVDGNAGATGQATVLEAGLTGPATTETTSGTINVGSPDGLTSVKVGGLTLTVAQLQALSVGSPQVIDTGEGTLTLTGFSGTGSAPLSGDISYTYTLKAALNQPGATESSDLIALEVTDRGGITTTGTLTVQIVDDTPTANADSNSLAEGTTSADSTVAGNVFIGSAPDVADRLGADTRANPVTAVSFGGAPQTVGSEFATAFGHLTLNADGSYNYRLDNTNATVNALQIGNSLSETVTYTITDADGDPSTTILTITINGTNDVPVVSNLPAATAGSVSEAGHLDDGTVVAGTVTATGDLNASDVDTGATQTWSLQGTPSTTYGSMAIDSSTGIWTYTLDNTKAATQALKEGDSVTQTYTARVTDDFGAWVDQTITVTINGTNDVPVAVADTRTVTEDAADQTGYDDGNLATTIVSGNVLTNDTDVDSGDKATLAVIGVAAGSLASASGNVATSVAGTYGSVSIAADGSYAYTLDNSKPTVQALARGQSVTDTFTYTITDSQGATSSTTLTVTVNGANDAPIITVRAGDADSASLTETNSGLIVSDTLSVFDVDTQDTVAASKVDSLVVGGTYSGARPNDTVLKGMFSVSGGEGSTVAQDAPNGIAWTFNSGAKPSTRFPPARP